MKIKRRMNLPDKEEWRVKQVPRKSRVCGERKEILLPIFLFFILGRAWGGLRERSFHFSRVNNKKLHYWSQLIYCLYSNLI